MVEITDLTAPELDIYCRLTEAQLRSRREPEKGIFIAESIKVISHGLDAGYTPLSLLMERKHIAGQARELIARCGDIPVFTADRDLLSQLTGYALTRGFCAPCDAVPCLPLRRSAPASGGSPCWRILWTPPMWGPSSAVQQPWEWTPFWSPPPAAIPCTGARCGSAWAPFFKFPGPGSVKSRRIGPEAGLARLRSLGFHTAAMALSDNSVDITSPQLTQKKQLAIVLGTEGDGLSSNHSQL